MKCGNLGKGETVLLLLLGVQVGDRVLTLGCLQHGVSSTSALSSSHLWAKCLITVRVEERLSRSV